MDVVVDYTVLERNAINLFRVTGDPVARQVGADEVSDHLVVTGRGGVRQVHTNERMGRDDIVLVGTQTADHVARRAELKVDPGPAVRELAESVGLQTEDVVLNDVRIAVLVVDPDALQWGPVED